VRSPDLWCPCWGWVGAGGRCELFVVWELLLMCAWVGAALLARCQPMLRPRVLLRGRLPRGAAASALMPCFTCAARHIMLHNGVCGAASCPCCMLGCSCSCLQCGAKPRCLLGAAPVLLGLHEGVSM